MEPQITQISAEKDKKTHVIIGSAMEVHRVLGSGFLEAVYQEALAVEFTTRNIPYQREVGITVSYKGVPLQCCYQADFVCFDSVIVELKAISTLTAVAEAQTLNYLRATDFELALLLNFGAASLQFRRLILSNDNLRKSAQSAVTSHV